MNISVKMDVQAVTRSLSNLQARQIPFATSQALNDTAIQARQQVIDKLDQYIDRPTPFTKRGFIYRRSSKSKLTAQVLILDNRWKYLKYQVRGGVRHPAGKAIPVGVAAKRNKYGNMGRNQLQTLINSSTSFVGEIDGVGGVWDRRTGRLLVAFVSKASYNANLPFYALVRAAVDKTFRRNFDRRMVAAIRSAR